MNDGSPPSALREMRAVFTSRNTLVALVAVAAVLTLVGPFGTNESLAPGFRALYWLTMVVATYAVGSVVDAVLRPRLGHRRAALVNPIAMAAAITLTVIAVNLLLLGRLPGGPGAARDILTIFAVAAIIAAAIQTVVASQRASEASGPGAAEVAPALLDRLPLEKRGALVALSVEDHYVRIRTTRGEELVLMRLSDAIRETAPAKGLQVHRSHWVAIPMVRSARREGDRAILGMAHGGDIPVSRSHMQAVKAAGLLPG